MKPANQLAIVHPEGPVSHQAALILQDYLGRVTRAEVSLRLASTEPPNEAVVVVIGNAARNPVAARAGFRQDWNGMRPDAYALRTIRSNGQTFVIAAGCGEAGDKYAVYRLMREVRVQGNRVEFGDYDVALNPFIKNREIIMGDAGPWDPYHLADQVPANERAATYDMTWDTPNLHLNFVDSVPAAEGPKTALRRIVERHCVENWPIERLPAYVGQMDAFGFNSLQGYDEWETYTHSGCLATRRQWRDKLLCMMQQNRKLGNRTTLQSWGGKTWVQNGVRVVRDWDDPLCDEPLVFRNTGNDFSSPCWYDPEDRRVLDAHLHYLSGYASHVDHVISHYADPGGCNRNGCTIGTAALLMNHQLDVFRGVNPRMEGTFNTWPLTSDHTGYRIGDVLHRATWNRTFSWWHFSEVAHLLHPEIMIANRWYDPRVADCCRRWGRRYGLWDWYSSDQEITASLHVEAERLARQFSALPKEAGEVLEYHSVSNNCHGLSSASLYIAAQLMWTPKRDAFEILREFCECVFGPRCAGAFYLGYEAVARIRNRDVRGDSAFNDTYLGAGTPDPAADAERSGAALSALRATTPDLDWISKIPMAVDSPTMYDDLVDHLTMIHQYACFREAFRKLLPKARILPEEWRALPKVERLRVSGGMIEFRHVADMFQNAGVFK